MLATGFSAKADGLEVLRAVADTTAKQQQQKPKQQSEKGSKSTKGRKAKVAKPMDVEAADVLKDIEQAVKQVPKARRQVKPISVPPIRIKTPVKIKTPKVKTALPVKIKL